MTFRGRLIGAVSAVTTVTLGGAFLIVYFAENVSQLHRLDDALHAVANEEAEEIATAAGPMPVLPIRPGPRANGSGPLPRYVVLYDGNGKVLSTSPHFETNAPRLSTLPTSHAKCFDLWSGREHLRGVLVDVPRRMGVHLLVATSRTDLDGDEAFLARAMISVFVFAVAWAVIVASWLVGRLTRDHQAITLVARRVAAGDLTARIGARRSDAEIDQLGRDIDDMIDRLGLLLTSQQRFIAHAAHELRSPLTTLYGELSHALRKERDAQSYRLTIEEALDSTRKLKVLTEDLLALARIVSSGNEPSEPLGIVDLVKGAAGAVAAEAAERQVEVEVTGDDALVSGRSLDLERMVRNLLENGIRHSPKGGKVVVGTGVRDTRVRIAVSDQGPGVLEADRERIFEPFYRGAAERAADVPGAGLGLAIAREIARVHGGAIRLVEQPDGTPGATFEIELRAASS
jgi:two-component system heavy metal sensor histidine kinase CusS